MHHPQLKAHIALREAGLGFLLVKVDLKTKITQDGAEFALIDPKGSVPVLQLGGGNFLTEGPAILQPIADQVPARQLAPPYGTIELYRTMEWLNFISTELHEGFGPLFRAGASEQDRHRANLRLLDRFALVSTQLQ